MQTSTLEKPTTDNNKGHAASMKLVIERAALLKSLGHIQSVVEKRGTIPILSNVKLEATGGKLHLTATDMDISVMEVVEAGVHSEGATTVPAHTLYEIVRKLSDGAEIELDASADRGKVSIRSGQSEFHLASLPVDDFPVMAASDFTHDFTVSAAECSALIEKTRFAISTEETRYYLNGIYLHMAGEDQKVLRAVATDGHRLARIEVALPAGADGMPGVIIPRKTIAELNKLVEDEVGEVQISVSESKIRFVCGSAVLVSKLIDGTFPDYERVIPAGNDKPMEVDAKRVAQAVDRVSVISSDKSRGVKLALENGKLTLSANSAENGTATEELEVNYAADPMDIGFNSRYLLEMLSQIEGDTAQFLLADSSSPAVVRDSADIGALYVVMPMRV